MVLMFGTLYPFHGVDALIGILRCSRKTSGKRMLKLLLLYLATMYTKMIHLEDHIDAVLQGHLAEHCDFSLHRLQPPPVFLLD